MVTSLLLLSVLQLATVVEPQERVTSRIVFVVDVSGSMKDDNGAELREAIGAVLEIARQGGDQLQVACWAFGADMVRWKPAAEEGVPEGWASMPNEEALKQLGDWLAKGPCDEDSTNAWPALLEAMRTPRDDLTVVLVSDGNMNDALGAPGVLALGQAERQKARLKPAVVAAYLVAHPLAGPPEAMRVVAALGKGGCWRRAPDPPREPLFPPVEGLRVLELGR